jgi:large conductance mechanosensitive channel
MISFLIVAFAVFMLIKIMNSLQEQPEEESAEPTDKECSFGCSSIPINATRCPQCTSELG